MDLLKKVTGKGVGGIVALAVVGGGGSWWRMDPATRDVIVSGTGKIIGWLMIVLLAPWVTFFATTWVARRDSNSAGAALVAAYTLVEALLLGWLFNWHVAGVTAWTFVIAGAL